MELDIIKSQTTWNDASQSINLNFAKIRQALASSGGGGGNIDALISTVYDISYLGSISTNDNSATFNAYAIDSLYKRIVLLENKEVDLTGYATEAWVAGQGFITSAALSPYMKTADANDTFATKIALNNLSSSHNSLATRVSTAEGNISTHATQISGLTTRMGNAETNISTNAKGIADNKTAIATNTSNISANATAISNNAKAISANTTAINTNATAITNLGKKVTANEGNIAKILKWFAEDSEGNICTTYNFYSTKEISANGLSVGSGGSGGGLISQVYGITAFGTIAAESNSATFNAYAIDSLYKRIVSLEGKATAVSFVPAMTSGKQIGTLSIDGVSTVLYAPAGYAWSEVSGKPTLIESEGVATDGSPKVNRFGLWQGKGAYWSIGHDSNYVIQAYATANGVYLRSLTGGTDSGWKRILREGDAYSKAEADGTFLKLTGGSIVSSTIGCPLYLANTKEIWNAIGFKGNSHSDYAYFGLGSNGNFFVTTTGWGTAYTLIHSGNIGEYKAGDSDKLGGVSEAEYARYSTNIYATYHRYIGYGTTTGGFPQNGGTVVAGITNYSMLLHGRNGVFRFNTMENGSLTGWKTVAFTDSNVASATKLATARTIWGQSFDGSGNVDGDFTQSINAYGTSPTISHKVQGSMADRYCALRFRFNAYDHFAGLDIESNKGVLATINSSGNVTIGSSDLAGTSAKLYVDGHIKLGTSGYLYKNSNTVIDFTSEDSPLFGYGTARAGKETWLCGNSINITYGTSLTTAIYITSGGNVGIGTTSPAYKLYVNGTANIANALTVATNVQIPINGDRITFSSATGTYTKGILAMNTSNTYLEAPLATDSASGAKPAIMIGWRGCSAATGTTKPYPITITSGEIALNGTTAINGTLKNVNNIYPNSAGERYIGTSTNPFKYMYAEWYGAGTGQTLSFGANNATHIWVDTSGNVGIGTNAPSQKLHVAGKGLFTDNLTSQGNVIGSGGVICKRGDNQIELNYYASGNRGLFDSATSKWLIYTNGTSTYLPLGSVTITGTITANSGVKVASGQALTFLDASGKEHKLTYDSTAGAFKFDGNILVLGDGQFNAIN